jgi:quercetin dioxygenase-like cupin family protein
VDTRTFVPPALTQQLVGPDDALPVRLYRVTFRDGARTYWHSHNDVQLLFGIGGSCLVVNREGEELLLEPGDVVRIDPGEEHWHGAAPGTEGEHLAINLGSETTWLESSA